MVLQGLLSLALRVYNAPEVLAVEVKYHAHVQSTDNLFAYREIVTSRETNFHRELSTELVSTSTCTNACVTLTMTSSEATVATRESELFTHGLALVLFELPAFQLFTTSRQSATNYSRSA